LVRVAVHLDIRLNCGRSAGYFFVKDDRADSRTQRESKTPLQG
jgi:hypothetical protein